MAKRFQVIRGDEQASTAAFEQYMGGVDRAQRIFRVYKDSYPGPALGFNPGRSKEEVFRAKAKAEGFNGYEIEAMLAIASAF